MKGPRREVVVVVVAVVVVVVEEEVVVVTVATDVMVAVVVDPVVTDQGKEIVIDLVGMSPGKEIGLYLVEQSQDKKNLAEKSQGTKGQIDLAGTSLEQDQRMKLVGLAGMHLEQDQMMNLAGLAGTSLEQDQMMNLVQDQTMRIVVTNHRDRKNWTSYQQEGRTSYQNSCQMADQTEEHSRPSLEGVEEVRRKPQGAKK